MHYLETEGITHAVELSAAVNKGGGHAGLLGFFYPLPAVCGVRALGVLVETLGPVKVAVTGCSCPMDFTLNRTEEISGVPPPHFSLPSLVTGSALGHCPVHAAV